MHVLTQGLYQPVICIGIDVFMTTDACLNETLKDAHIDACEMS